MVLLAVIALGVPLAINLSARVHAEVRTQAQTQADLVAATAADLLGVGQRGALQTLAGSAGSSIRGRILIVDSAGSAVLLLGRGLSDWQWPGTALKGITA